MLGPARKQITVELFGEQLPLDLSLGFVAQASFESGHKILEDPTFFGELDKDAAKKDTDAKDADAKDEKPVRMKSRPGEVFRLVLLLYAGLLHLGRGWTIQDVQRQLTFKNLAAIKDAVTAAVARDMMPVGTDGDAPRAEGEQEDPFVVISGSASGPLDDTTSG